MRHWSWLRRGETRLLCEIEAMSSEQDTLAGSNDSQRVVGPGATEATLSVGERVGRYVLIDRLGQGGMGVVWSAYDPELDRKVAIKVLHAAPRTGPQPIDRAFGKVMHGLFGDEPATPGAVAFADPGQQRLLREAQAAARINDDNVVTVHDVGQHEGRVFIAMEFVAGVTLRQWLVAKPREWREVVDVMARAGSGLAAAHESGLVHRDFKPDNLMIGNDGRVRVMDFGLVRPDEGVTSSSDAVLRPTTDALALELTRGGSTMGTPAYMSPEQHLGVPVDARSDQFSFCVALWEALYGARPFTGTSMPELVVSVTTGIVSLPDDTRKVPTQLRRVVERGLSVERETRWPSMRALVAELRRDPTQKRRRIVIATVGLGVVAAAFGAWQIDRARALSACRDDASAITRSWNDDVRTQVHDALVGSATVYAVDSAATVERTLDAYAERWSTLRGDTCVAMVRGEASPSAPETITCLDERASDLGDVVAMLKEPDAFTMRRAVWLASGLGPPAECALEATLHLRRLQAGDEAIREQTATLRERIRRAQLSTTLRRHADAKAELEAVVADARAIEADAVVALAMSILGRVHERLGDYATAEKTLIDGIFIATAAGDESHAAACATELVSVVGQRLERFDDALLWERWAEVLVGRIGGAEDLPGAVLEDRRAGVAQARGDFADATTRLQHALAIKRDRLGAAHPELANTLVSLGNAQMQSVGVDAAAASWEEARDILERSVGPSHPDLGPVLSSLAQVAFRRGDPSAARAYLERAIAIAVAETGESHPEVGKLLGNLGIVLQLSNDVEGAKAAVTRSTKILEATLGEEHPSLANNLDTLASLELRLGHVDESIALQRRAIAIQERAHGPDHIGLVPMYGDLGGAYKVKGDREAAQTWYRHALVIAQKSQPGGHPIHTPTLLAAMGELARLDGRTAEASAMLDRAIVGLEASGQAPEDIAKARYNLALALWDQAQGRARAITEIDAARVAMVERGDADGVAKIDAWLAEHPR